MMDWARIDLWMDQPLDGWSPVLARAGMGRLDDYAALESDSLENSLGVMVPSLLSGATESPDEGPLVVNPPRLQR